MGHDLRTMKNAFEVDVDNSVKQCFRAQDEGSDGGPARHRGVVDENVDGAEMLNRLLDHALDLPAIRHIYLQLEHLGLAQVDWVLVDLRDHNLGAVTRQYASDTQANAGSSTGHNRYFAGEFHASSPRRCSGEVNSDGCRFAAAAIESGSLNPWPVTRQTTFS